MVKSKINIRQMKDAVEMLKALAHPTRLAVFELLCDKGSLTVSEIQKFLKIEQAVVSQQLSILRSKDVLVCEREGNKSVYSLKYRCLSKILDCLDKCK